MLGQISGRGFFCISLQCTVTCVPVCFGVNPFCTVHDIEFEQMTDIHFVSHEMGTCYDAFIGCNERHDAKVTSYNFVADICLKRWVFFLLITFRL